MLITAMYKLTFFVLALICLSVSAFAQTGGMALAPARFELEMKPGTETTVVVNLDYKAGDNVTHPARIVATLGGVDDFDQRASAHVWRAVVTDEGDGVDAPPAIRAHYQVSEAVDGPGMKTGVRTRPAFFWVPRSTP